MPFWSFSQLSLKPSKTYILYWSNAQSSADVAAPAPSASAPVAARTQLPTGVRVVLSFEGGAVAGNLTRDVLLAPQP